MSKSESYALDNLLKELTNGQPFVFVAMAYKSGYSLYKQIAAVVTNEVKLRCIRADHISGSGHDLLAKIHFLIERAELVIAEITEQSPNVFYEIGYAVAKQKPLVLLTRKGKDVPTDLKGRELIEYQETKEGMDSFDKRLCEHLKVRVNSRVALLRDMLEAENPRPVYIVASPRYPTPPTIGKIKGQPPDQRTFGDNLGIRGLMSAFGSIFGETDGVELVSAQYPPRKLLKRNVNLYLIGSDKVNEKAGIMLEKLLKRCKTKWFFNPPKGEKRVGDWQVVLYKTQGGETSPKIGKTKMVKVDNKKELIHSVDYGIIVRGPHPYRRNRIVLIMAGAHSLGTGAACLAATRSVLIHKVKKALPKGVDFADKSRTIWVLVKGTGSRKDGLLDETGVDVVKAGCW